MPQITKEAMTENQLNILRHFKGEYEWYYPFSHFDDLGMDRKTIAKEFKGLRALGLVEFHKGLMTEEGECAGSGYGLNYAKHAEIDELTKEVVDEKDKWKIEFDRKFCFDNYDGGIYKSLRTNIDQTLAIKSFISSLLTQSKEEARKEVDEIDIMLAMVQSTTDDTPHSEMIEMISNIRKHLASLTKTEGK